MAQAHLFNSRKVGGPSIVIPIPGRNEVIVPAEGKPNGTKDELIEDAVGVVVEVGDLARLQKQASQIRGLVVK